MSTQSILKKDKNSLLREVEDQLLCDADAVFTKEKFLVGAGADAGRIQYNMLLHRLLCTDYCEMVEYINKKIAGETECDGCKISETIEHHKKHHKKEHCSDTEIVSESCPINNPEW